MHFLRLHALKLSLQRRRSCAACLIPAVGLLVLWFTSQPVYAQPENQLTGRNIFLPVVFGEQRGAETVEQTPNPAEEQFAALLVSAARQQHPILRWNATLARVAHDRATDMGIRNFFGHTDPDGFGPNYHVRQAGYQLPDNYATANDANNIESIAAGYASVDEVFTALTQSAVHRTHLFGEIPFYQEQIDYGIGYVHLPNSAMKHYWVIVIAKPG
jgi:uncharacterized protein YkwD